MELCLASFQTRARRRDTRLFEDQRSTRRPLVHKEHRHGLHNGQGKPLEGSRTAIGRILQESPPVVANETRWDQEDGNFRSSKEKIVQNKPRSWIQACVLTSRSFHADLHAYLHDNDNA